MAKQHAFSQVSFWIGNIAQTIKNQQVRLRFRLGFTTKHDGDAVSTDHSATFDIVMSMTRILELCKDSLVIALQNKILRPKTAANALKWLREHDPITYDDIFPGKGAISLGSLAPEDAAVKLSAGRSKEDLIKMREELEKMIAKS